MAAPLPPVALQRLDHVAPRMGAAPAPTGAAA
jgi:hypothetical protein